MNHADVHKEENGNSDEKSKYFCDTCQKPYGGKNNLAAHLKSKIHLRKLELLENSKENLKSPEKKPNTENEKVDKETQSYENFNLEDTEKPRKKRKLTNKKIDSNPEINSETKKEVRFTRNSMKKYEKKIEKPNLEDAYENCRICDKSFKKKHLKTHLKTFHNNLKPEKESKSTSNSKKRKIDENPEVDDFDEDDYYVDYIQGSQ